MVSAFPYEFPLREMIFSLKYKQQLSLAHDLGLMLADKVISSGVPLPDQLVPVPLHPLRMMRRGFNQALEIARSCGRRLGLPVSTYSVRRRRQTRAQYSLKAAQKTTNVKGAFSARPFSKQDNIAIIDDIVTSGATATELALTLRHAGAGDISLWTCCRAD